MAEEKPAEISVETDEKTLKIRAGDGALKAQYLLALKYATGTGLDPNPKGAEKWYRKAAKRKFAPAMNNLGLLLGQLLNICPNINM